MVDAVNTAAPVIAVIEGIAQGGDASGIDESTLITAGVSGVDTANLAAYQSAISAAADGALDTVAEIQAMIDAVNTAAVITLVIPNDRMVNAVGFFTGVNLDPDGIASATDAGGNVIEVVADQTGPFESGSYDILWSATSAGRTISATQSLKVIPKVNLATPITTTEGNTLAVEVLLSGQAAAYPVTVSYIVSGTAVEGDDYTVDPTGSVTISEGTMASISLSITADGVAESEETVVITLGEPTNAVLGLSSEQVITIVEENLPPQVTLQVSQAGVVGSSIAQNAGTAMINPEIVDANAADAHTVDWTNALLTLPEATVVVVDGEGPEFPYEVLTFEPADLTTGVYLVVVDVNDGVNSVSVAASINVLAQAPDLSEESDSDGDGTSDADEGAGDSDGDGIPDYEDNITSSNTIMTNSGVMESEPGTTLRLGTIALTTERNEASVTEADISIVENITEDQSYDYPADLTDFEVTGAEFGHSYIVVMQLSVAITEDAVYRKYSVRGGWADFVENATNAISSAMTVEGVCPELGSDAYTPGLTAGDNCLQLWIEDGGPNDADGVANGTLIDPAGVAVKVIGTPTDNSEVMLQEIVITADGVDSTQITVTAYDDQGIGLEHMSVTASMLVPGVVVSDFVEQGGGVYTATVNAGMTAGTGPVTVVIDNGEMSIVLVSARLRLAAVSVPKSGGGGCTVATDNSADASLLLLLIMAGLLLARRRYQLR